MIGRKGEETKGTEAKTSTTAGSSITVLTVLSTVPRSFRFTPLEWNEKRRNSSLFPGNVLLFCNRDSGPKRGRHNECGQVCPSFEERKKRSRVRSERRTAREERNETLRWVEKNGPLAYNFSSLVRISFDCYWDYTLEKIVLLFFFSLSPVSIKIATSFLLIFPNMQEACRFHLTNLDSPL